MPFPWAGRGKGSGTGRDTAGENLTRSRGKLRKIEEKSIQVEAPDGRSLDFRRTSSTKFYRNSDEIGASYLHAGDEVSVEATQDQDGYLYARNVRLERSGEAAEEQTGKAAEEPSVGATERAPAPAPRDREDPGPPALRHGIPPKRPGVESQEEEPSSAAPVEPAAEPAADPLLEKARQAAESFSEGLPNYYCAQYMTRFASTSRPANWKPLDVVSANVVYENGRESYRDLAVDGKPTRKRFEELGGAWSTGEFGSLLRDLFSRSTAADFRFGRNSSASGVAARVYDFEVERDSSHWRVQAPSQSIHPAYKGSVWIEPESGRVLRLEIQARLLPEEFPIDVVESVIDYASVRIGSGQFLLPVHAETLSCQRGTQNCSRNTIDFRNYHKYEAESSITFETPTR